MFCHFCSLVDKILCDDFWTKLTPCAWTIPRTWPSDFAGSSREMFTWPHRKQQKFKANGHYHQSNISEVLAASRTMCSHWGRRC